MLVDYAYTLQIRLTKDNVDDVQAAAQRLGFLDLDKECKKVNEQTPQNFSKLSIFFQKHASFKKITFTFSETKYQIVSSADS